jgi:hypothetical protein
MSTLIDNLKDKKVSEFNDEIKQKLYDMSGAKIKDMTAEYGKTIFTKKKEG